MVGYRRHRVSGGTYFFTVTLQDRRSDVLVRHVHALRDAWRTAGRRVPHHIEAVVVLPEHLHALLRMTDGQDDYPALWREIKKGFTRRLLAAGVGLARRGRGYALWQHRYWEHTIRGEADMRAHVDYIHYNPVKHGWVKRPCDWPWSSFHRYVRHGMRPANWACDPMHADLRSRGEPIM